MSALPPATKLTSALTLAAVEASHPCTTPSVKESTDTSESAAVTALFQLSALSPKHTKRLPGEGKRTASSAKKVPCKHVFKDGVWTDPTKCPYGAGCRFAHGSELTASSPSAGAGVVSRSTSDRDSDTQASEQVTDTCEQLSTASEMLDAYAKKQGMVEMLREELERAKEKFAAEKAEVERLRRRAGCRRCTTSLMTHVATPCGHPLCSACLPSLSSLCPSCSVRIDWLVPLSFS